MAQELREKHELVVVTNGLRIAEALADAPGVSVILPGGVLRQAAMSLVGDFANAVLRSTRIGKGFFGARGISLDRGLMDLNPEEVRFKRELADACEQVVGVFDHTKWERSALLSFVPAHNIDMIVTDERAPLSFCSNGGNAALASSPRRSATSRRSGTRRCQTRS